MSRRRSPVEKALGRYQSSNYYALVPEEVQFSASYAAVPDFAARVLVALAGAYRGRNNGDVSLTWAEARRRGVSSEWKLRAGLPLLEVAGLILVTRPGGNVAGGVKVPTLYALGWLPIAASDKYPNIPGAMAKAPNAWATWTPPNDWRQTIEGARRRAQGKKPHHTREAQPAQPVRGNPNGYRHTRGEQQGARIATHGGATSRDIGRGCADLALALMARQPHLGDFDIARALGWKIEPYAVRRLRESVAQSGGPTSGSLLSMRINGDGSAADDSGLGEQQGADLRTSTHARAREANGN